MKNLSSRVSEKGKFKSQDIKDIGQGITKILLDKYKPKDLFQIAIMSAPNNKTSLA